MSILEVLEMWHRRLANSPDIVGQVGSAIHDKAVASAIISDMERFTGSDGGDEEKVIIGKEASAELKVALLNGGDLRMYPIDEFLPTPDCVAEPKWEMVDGFDYLP